mgnify:CR=1 FL=1
MSDTTETSDNRETNNDTTKSISDTTLKISTKPQVLLPRKQPQLRNVLQTSSSGSATGKKKIYLFSFNQIQLNVSFINPCSFLL